MTVEVFGVMLSAIMGKLANMFEYRVILIALNKVREDGVLE